MFFAVNKQSGFADIFIFWHACGCVRACVRGIWCPRVKLAHRPWNPARRAGHSIL